MIHSSIEKKLLGLNIIFKRYNVQKAYLFGSACTEAFSDTSDIDLLIEPGYEKDPVVKRENLWGLYYDLKNFFGRDIDLVTRESLANKYFISEVNRTSVPIYG